MRDRIMRDRIMGQRLLACFGRERGHVVTAMLKRRMLLRLLLLGVAVAVGLFVAGAFREREPEYGGRRLSQWMEVLVRNPPETRDQVKEAFRQIGPATIPYLLKCLRGKETPAWKRKFRHAFNGVAKRMCPRWVLPEKDSLNS